jgi:Ca2+/Na+ antiporter
MEKRAYEEKVSSSKTEVLFVALTSLFLLLFTWRFMISRSGLLTIIFLCCFILFLFYSFNYRTLVIRLSSESLILRFGIFTWRVQLDNIEAYYLDDISLWRIGGAGIHFTVIRGKYRAFLNFLEHPRVVVALKKKKGPVREIAFSTINPEEVFRILQACGENPNRGR